jgi:hypothetical protein
VIRSQITRPPSFRRGSDTPADFEDRGCDPSDPNGNASRAGCRAAPTRSLTEFSVVRARGGYAGRSDSCSV